MLHTLVISLSGTFTLVPSLNPPIQFCDSWNPLLADDLELSSLPADNNPCPVPFATAACDAYPLPVGLEYPGDSDCRSHGLWLRMSEQRVVYELPLLVAGCRPTFPHLSMGLCVIPLEVLRTSCLGGYHSLRKSVKPLGQLFSYAIRTGFEPATSTVTG